MLTHHIMDVVNSFNIQIVRLVSRRINRPFEVLTNFLVSHLSTLYVQGAETNPFHTEIFNFPYRITLDEHPNDVIRYGLTRLLYYCI